MPPDKWHRMSIMNSPSRFQFSIRLLLLAAALAAGTIWFLDRRYRGQERAAAFFDAMRAYNYAEIDRLLIADPDLAHGRTHYGVTRPQTALQTAAGLNEKVLRRILQESPDLEEKSAEGQTALEFAVSVFKLETVTALLNAGADVHVASLTGKTPLHISMEGNWVSIAQILAQHGADLLAKDSNGEIPGEGFPENNLVWWDTIVRYFEEGRVGELENMFRAAPQVLNWSRPSPLLAQAAKANRIDVIELLLSCGANPNQKWGDFQERDNSTVLHYLSSSDAVAKLSENHESRSDYKAIVTRLIQAGSDINALDARGRTPLHFAAIAHNHIMLHALLKSGANINVVDESETTVMDSAFQYNFSPGKGVRTLRILRESGHPATILSAAAIGDLDQLRRQEDSIDQLHGANNIGPVFAAVVANQPKTVKWLLKHGANGNALTPARWSTAWGDSLLRLALSYGHTDVAIALIEGGVELDGFPNGQPPLLTVVQWGCDVAVFETLMKHGADPSFRHGGKTVRQHIVELAPNQSTEIHQKYIRLLDTAKESR